MNSYRWATNYIKLRRIMDKMPNASEEEIRAEYIKQGGFILVVNNPELDEDAILQHIHTAEIEEETPIVEEPKKETKVKSVTPERIGKKKKK